MGENVCKEDLEGFFPKTRLFGCHGKGKNKAIDVLTDPINKRVWYELSDHHRVIWCGPDIDEAINIYNAI